MPSFSERGKCRRTWALWSKAMRCSTLCGQVAKAGCSAKPAKGCWWQTWHWVSPVMAVVPSACSRCSRWQVTQAILPPSPGAARPSATKTAARRTSAGPGRDSAGSGGDDSVSSPCTIRAVSSCQWQARHFSEFASLRASKIRSVQCKGNPGRRHGTARTHPPMRRARGREHRETVQHASTEAPARRRTPARARRAKRPSTCVAASTAAGKASPDNNNRRSATALSHRAHRAPDADCTASGRRTCTAHTPHAWSIARTESRRYGRAFLHARTASLCRGATLSPRTYRPARHAQW